MDIALTLLGFVVGTLVGLTGVGAGSLLTPTLVLLGVRPALAVATSLVHAIPMKIVGAYQHLRLGTVNLRIVFYLACGSVPVAFLGGRVFLFLQSFVGEAVLDAVIKRSLAVVLVLVSGMYLLDLLITRSGVWDRVRELTWSPLQKTLTIGLGGIVGLIVSFTSIGSGTLTGATLFYWYRRPAREVVGTVTVQALFMTGAAGIGHLFSGTVNLHTVLLLLIGSLPGVVLGSRLAVHAPQRAVRGTLAVVLFVTGLRMF